MRAVAQRRSRWTARAAVAIGIAAMLLPIGCATHVRVEADETADFARYRSWGWRIPARPPDAQPDPADLRLAHALAVGIYRELSARGFEYVGAEGDLLVTPELRVTRIRSSVHRAEADYYLVSHHFSPSYQITGLSRRDVEIWEASELEIVLVDRLADRVVWRGELTGRFRDSFAAHLEQSVAQLLQPLPMASPDEPDGLRMLTQRREGSAP